MLLQLVDRLKESAISQQEAWNQRREQRIQNHLACRIEQRINKVLKILALQERYISTGNHRFLMSDEIWQLQILIDQFDARYGTSAIETFESWDVEYLGCYNRVEIWNRVVFQILQGNRHLYIEDIQDTADIS